MRHLPIISVPSETIPLQTLGGLKGKEIIDTTEKHGALLLRGFSCNLPHEFSSFVSALHLEPFLSVGESAAPRKWMAPYVYTANEAPADAQIPFHHEMAQSRYSPRYIIFYCQSPPRAGEGRTPLMASRDVAGFVRRHYPRESDRLFERGIRYIRILPPETDTESAIGKSWKDAFNCWSMREAEAALRTKGFDWSWLPCGSLKMVTPTCPVFGCDHLGRETFFNSVVAARMGWNDRRNAGEEAVVFGNDGTPFDEATKFLFDDAALFMEENAVRADWNRGDVLVVDNMQMLHARESFSRFDNRAIMASLWGRRCASTTKELGGGKHETHIIGI